MRKIVRTDADNANFRLLVALLDADLAERDGEDHAFYNQFNAVDSIKFVVLIFEESRAVACGAIKEYEPGIMEVKRMYTMPDYRSIGLAGQILQELEVWAAEMQFKKCILETGKKQPEAISFYKSKGYKRISNYGQYAGIANSVCFEKLLS